MSSDLRQCSREFLTEFIEIYKSYPCLWQIKNKVYHDRNKKNIAYDELVKKYQEVDPAANKETITKKINSLRSVYKKELAKVKKSETTGTGEDELYKPQLWYFDLLDFLNDPDEPRTPRETIGNDEESASVVMEEESVEQEDSNHIEFGNIPSTPEGDSHSQSSAAASTNRSRCSSRKRLARSTDDQIIDVLSKAEKKLESVTTNDSFDIYGKHIADRLQQINPGQIKFVQKLVSDVLFEGEMESLNTNWTLVDIGQKEVHSRTSVQETYPPHFERFSQYKSPRAYSSNYQQIELANQPSVYATNQPSITLAEMGPPVAISSLTDYLTNFSQETHPQDNNKSVNRFCSLILFYFFLLRTTFISIINED